jgi:hypothetical protein
MGVVIITVLYFIAMRGVFFVGAFPASALDRLAFVGIGINDYRRVRAMPSSLLIFITINLDVTHRVRMPFKVLCVGRAAICAHDECGG